MKQLVEIEIDAGRGLVYRDTFVTIDDMETRQAEEGIRKIARRRGYDILRLNVYPVEEK